MTLGVCFLFNLAIALCRCAWNLWKLNSSIKTPALLDGSKKEIPYWSVLWCSISLEIHCSLRIMEEPTGLNEGQPNPERQPEKGRLRAASLVSRYFSGTLHEGIQFPSISKGKCSTWRAWGWGSLGYVMTYSGHGRSCVFFGESGTGVPESRFAVSRLGLAASNGMRRGNIIRGDTWSTPWIVQVAIS